MPSRLWLVIPLLAGCDVVFRLDDLQEGPADGPPTDTGGTVDVGDGPQADPRIVARFDFEGTLVETKTQVMAGCLSGCPMYKAGKHGMGIELDGVNKCLRFTLPTTLPANPTQLTIAVWINEPIDRGASIVAKPFGGAGANSFQVDVEPNRTVRFITYNGSVNDVLMEDAAFAINAWQHIAVTLDGGKKIFVNGAMTPMMTASAKVVTDSSELLIGCDRDSGNYVRFFLGVIDEVIVFNAALTPSEISSLVTQ